jgi:hypothetical protein
MSKEDSVIKGTANDPVCGMRVTVEGAKQRPATRALSIISVHRAVSTNSRLIPSFISHERISTRWRTCRPA